MEINRSSIFIINDIDETLNNLISTLPKHNTRVIRNEEKDEFLLAQASIVIKEAYIASKETKYIILCGSSFRVEAQNSLLKIFEEPPKNIIFIILATSKSSLLPTVLSRMPHKFLKKTIKKELIDLDILKLDLKEVYTILKTKQKITKIEAKELVENILFKLQKQSIILSQKELDIFSKSIKLLDLNSRPISVLTSLFLTLIQRKT